MLIQIPLNLRDANEKNLVCKSEVIYSWFYICVPAVELYPYNWDRDGNYYTRDIILFIGGGRLHIGQKDISLTNG